jgi:hypothetical protein
VAWPAGNSGTVAFFAPKNGVNGSLSIELVAGSSDNPLSGIYEEPASDSLSGNPVVGVRTLVRFNSSAILTVPILGEMNDNIPFHSWKLISTRKHKNNQRFH